MATKQRGLLIVFEGIDGTGKSTQLQLLHRSLKERGYRVVATREPTDGPHGQQIRRLYRRREQVSQQQELELFLADRREHVQALIEPSLADGCIVLCDRYYLSTAAYQGAVGLNPNQILADNSFAPVPDLALLFELDVVEAVRRITEQRGDRLNDFEQREYLQKVAAVFTAMRLPYIRRIDASPDTDDIHRVVRSLVDNLLNQQGT